MATGQAALVDTWPDYEYGWVCQHRVIKIYKGLLLRQEVQADVDLIAQIESKLTAEYSKLLELYPTSPPARAVERQLTEQGPVSPSGTELGPFGTEGKVSSEQGRAAYQAAYSTEGR